MSQNTNDTVIDDNFVQIDATNTINVVCVNDTEANNAIVNELASLAQQLNMTDFTHSGKIEDYLPLLQQAQNLTSTVKNEDLQINNVNMLASMAETAENIGQLLSRYTSIIQENTYTITNNNLITSLQNSLTKIFRFLIDLKKFKETIRITTTINKTKTFDTVNNLLNNIIPTINNGLQYINYFADSQNVTDINIIENAQLSSEDITDIQEAMDTLTESDRTFNDIIDSQKLQITNKIDLIVSNNTLLQNTLNKLQLKLDFLD